MSGVFDRRSRLSLALWVTTVLAPMLAVEPAIALESAATTSPRVTATLISDAARVAPGQTFRVGLRQKLAPHWHTYWKNPGDSGLPTKLTLTLPDGIEAGAIAWPAPQRFVLADIVNYGYADRALLPLTIDVPASLAASEITIRAKASYV